MQQLDNNLSFKAHDGHPLFNSGQDNDNDKPIFPFNIDFDKDPSKRLINDLTREYNNIVPDYTAYIFKDPDSITEIRGY